VKYLSLRADEELAAEYLRLRVKSLAAGLGTAVEVIDAQLNLAKVQAEQTGAAYEYDMALAALLASTGELDQFSRWAMRADILHRR
jgi:outer membrane protein TolC